ncbi:MAG: hypothetical protein CME62_10125 [Halobacteriovoraceae bacterium]|nr:hypothetical protein [Halobacteriovoraceae bacterium]|tara:strand:- start:21790 stop:22356 length:567 start_codon:yes stop_codon:yes gene_type:complete
MKISDYILQYDELAKAQEIVFFGGSFNPWHEGHTSCIRLLPADLPIVIVPDHNPFKKLTKTHEKLTSPAQIVKQIQFLNRNIFIYDGFFIREEKNPTNVWINELKLHLPMTKISFLVGYDTFMAMPKWINIEKLLKDLDCLYVASRLENDQHHSEDAQQLYPAENKLEIKFLGHHNFEHLSSTELRKS